MPSWLVNGARDEPLAIPGTDRTVTFKSVASYGDDLHCDVVASHFAPAPAMGPDEARLLESRRREAYVLARTSVMIVAWDLTDEAGNPLPITAETISSLAVPVGNFLASEARRRFEGRTEEEEIPFASPSPEPSPAAARRTRR